MKYKGQTISNDNVSYAVIPRKGFDITFVARPILDYAEFNRKCPAPTPPYGKVPGGEKKPILDDPDYILRQADYNSQRTAWIFLESVKTSPDIVWDTVDMSKPETWPGYEAELIAAQFTNVEINLIAAAVLKANSLDNDQLNEARERFLASLLPQQST